jgi:hypothetical protein
MIGTHPVASERREQQGRYVASDYTEMVAQTFISIATRVLCPRRWKWDALLERRKRVAHVGLTMQKTAMASLVVQKR